MSLPYFFVDDLSANELVLNEDSSKHIIQVLRKETGDEILLTDGKGTKAKAEIRDDHRKHCGVRILSRQMESATAHKVCIAISLLKNTARFEWFLEKATEIGVNEIIPLICTRTEKEKFRQERLQHILISALLQSQQCWLPTLHDPMEFKKSIALNNYEHKYIAHCLEEDKQTLVQHTFTNASLILIGPEGDFTDSEIQLALKHQFIPVSLGNTRLRAETAGMVAATLMCIR